MASGCVGACTVCVCGGWGASFCWRLHHLSMCLVTRALHVHAYAESVARERDYCCAQALRRVVCGTVVFPVRVV
jgi:hypothetical protein